MPLYAVSTVLVKPSSTGFNIRNILSRFDAVSEEEAKGKATCAVLDCDGSQGYRIATMSALLFDDKPSPQTEGPQNPTPLTQNPNEHDHQTNTRTLRDCRAAG